MTFPPFLRLLSNENKSPQKQLVQQYLFSVLLLLKYTWRAVYDRERAEVGKLTIEKFK